MAVNTKMPLTNTADGYLCEGTDIRGGYFVIDKTENIPSTIAKTGSLCYCTDDSKFCQFDGTTWVEAKLGGVELGTTADTAAAGNHSHREFGSLIPYGTSILEDVDLNTTDYLKVGNYYCSKDAFAETLLNCPTDKAFIMQVFAPLSTKLDNETTSA